MKEHNDLRSNNSSYKDIRVQMDNNSNNYYKTGMQDLRCYSASYASSGQMDVVVAAGGGGGEQWKFKKGKSISGVLSKNWNLNDPEVQRKKRVAGYKVYTVEGKVKGSVKKSFRWLKQRCSLIIPGHK